MLKLCVAAAAAAFAVPALAQGPAAGDPLADEIVRALPPAEQVEAMAPAMDRALGALLEVDVGPIIDAADPWHRHPGYGRPGRTLGELARRDDPHFDDRLRASLYGATADVGRMMGAFAAAAPALARSLREIERAMDAAIAGYGDPRGAPPEVWDD